MVLFCIQLDDFVSLFNLKPGLPGTLFLEL